MRFQTIMRFAGSSVLALAVMASPVRSLAQGGDTVLKPADTQKLLAGQRVLQGPVGAYATAELDRHQVC